jgi:putative endonuclease
VASDGATLVFVEVKARATAEFGTAAEAVTRRKQLRLVRMARDYLTRAAIRDRPCRFDVVAIDEVETSPIVAVYRNAFDAG